MNAGGAGASGADGDGGDAERDRPRRLSRAESKSRTREQLLDAAAVIFSRKGFVGATVEEIAETAGYTIGALYSNFAGKEQLFLELLSARRTRGVSRRMTAISQILDEEPSEGTDPFDEIGRLFRTIADRNSEFAPLQAEFWLYAVRNPEAMDVIATKLREQRDALEPLVGRALERLGASPEIPVREAATVALGLIQGLVHQRRVDAAAVPDELFADALRWVFRGLVEGTGRA